jgi:hypothetical protein
MKTRAGVQICTKHIFFQNVTKNKDFTSIRHNTSGIQAFFTFFKKTMHSVFEFKCYVQNAFF